MRICSTLMVPPIGTTRQAKASHLNSKQSDYGRLNGRLVVLDYSTPAHDTPEGLLN